MTENFTPPTGPEAPTAEQRPPRRLRRSNSDRVISGVSGGVGRHLDVDPVLIRIAFVALALFGGAGVLLYVAALLLMPADDGTVPVAPGASADGRNRALAVVGVVVAVVVVGPLLFIPALAIGGLVVPLAFLTVGGLLTAWLVTGRQPERDAGSLTRAALLGLGVLALVFALAVGAFWASAIGGDEVVAGLVIAAGAALVAGAFLRPVRWLILPALAIALPAGFVAAAGVELDGGIGERTYRPGTVSEIRSQYELGMGELVVDLRGVDVPDGQRVRLDVGMGHAQVIVDEGVCVGATAEVGAGAVNVLGNDNGGVDLDVDELPRPKPGNPRLVVEADMGIGLVEVTHDRGPGRRGFGEDRWDGPFVDENDACVTDAA
jgi:phage shock protein PspC (stress-responsive transcriptional regulator)